MEFGKKKEKELKNAQKTVIAEFKANSNKSQ